MGDVDPMQERVFRSRVADFLFGLQFPATRQAIIQRARHNNTTSQVVEALSDLPDQTYADLAAVQTAVAYHPPRVWDVEGFPPAALRHDEVEAERIRRNTQRVARPNPPRR
ncbi:MAG: DUF2795 domain-containing protein [Chloroflexi bacterium]|nr:DUF2795 domain-containing protein [Chloroflexota bacterium]